MAGDDAIRRMLKRGLMRRAPAPRAPRRRFGRYVLRRELGRGGMGTVYEAWDAKLGRSVALKMLSPGQDVEATAAKRLLAEARAVARLGHAGIVAVHDVGTERGRPFFTMELVEGTTLEALLSAPARAFPLRRRLEILAQVAEALAFAHSRGIVHRDLKPANVLVDAAGRARLTDFGLARDLAGPEGPTISGLVLGTPHYMSPEQASGRRGRVGPASDVFSFGVMLYRAATGRLPFGGEGLASLHRTLHHHPAPPSGKLPAGLVEVCMRCLEKDPRRRYAGGAALSADLRLLLAGKPVKARAAKAPVRRGAEALRLLELGRPSLDRALKAAYDPEADDADVGRAIGEARGKFEEAARRDPDVPLAPYLAGLTLELEGDLPAAERAFRRALGLDPDLGPAHYWLGRILLIRSYTEGMRPSGEAPARLVARRERVRQVSEEACRCFDAALARGSGFEDALQKRVAEAMLARARGDRDGLRRACEAGLAAFPRTAGREEFHWVRSLMEAPEAGLEDIRKALAIRPRYPLALYARSRALRELGDHAGAAADLRLVVRWWPRFFPGWISLFGAGMLLDRVDEAESAAGRALELDPRHAGAWLNRSVVRFRRGDFAGAVEDCTRSIALDPLNAISWTNRGQGRARLGRLRGAIADFREALRLDPSVRGAREDLEAARAGARRSTARRGR